MLVTCLLTFSGVHQRRSRTAAMSAHHARGVRGEKCSVHVHVHVRGYVCIHLCWGIQSSINFSGLAFREEPRQCAGEVAEDGHAPIVEKQRTCDVQWVDHHTNCQCFLCTKELWFYTLFKLGFLCSVVSENVHLFVLAFCVV